MQATTSGVIRNKTFLNEEFISNFLKKEKLIFDNLLDKQSVLYSKDVVVSDVALNYLNMLPSNEGEDSLKNIILKEYYDCEKIYPYLGDYLLYKFFKTKVKKTKKGLYSKKEQSNFIDSLKSKTNKALASWMFDNINLKRNINIESYNGNNVCVEFIENFTFDLAFDESLTKQFNNQSFKEYKFIIADGYIESIGEIHHLLYKANETREPYVIFCFGMAEEVKVTITKNNQAGRFIVVPIVLDPNDESSLNILNDLAVIQNGHVISSILGQTISQEVRKDLKSGKEITLLGSKIVIEPCVSQEIIMSHRSFLKKRIEEGTTGLNPSIKIEPIEKRLRMFAGKRLNVFIPKKNLYDKKYCRELDYFLRFCISLNKQMCLIELKSQKFYIPTDYINIVNDKIVSLNKKLSNIKVVII